MKLGSIKFKKIAAFIASGFLFFSLFFPYLFIIFTSPQYPDRSPKMFLYTYGIKGDVQEWKVVGRYIGINVEPNLPELDLKIIAIIVVILGMFTFISAFRSGKWKKIVSISLIVTGISLALWAQYRLYQAGHNLDPKAPLRNVAKPFTPPLIGMTKISKIKIYHLPHLGSILFVTSTILTFYASSGQWIFSFKRKTVKNARNRS
ncbi:MAG: hypothetical protein AB1410_05180 [Acidobacteriota bacterium]